MEAAAEEEEEERNRRTRRRTKRKRTRRRRKGEEVDDEERGGRRGRGGEGRGGRRGRVGGGGGGNGGAGGGGGVLVGLVVVVADASRRCVLHMVHVYVFIPFCRWILSAGSTTFPERRTAHSSQEPHRPLPMSRRCRGGRTLGATAARLVGRPRIHDVPKDIERHRAWVGAGVSTEGGRWLVGA